MVGGGGASVFHGVVAPVGLPLLVFLVPVLLQKRHLGFPTVESRYVKGTDAVPLPTAPSPQSVLLLLLVRLLRSPPPARHPPPNPPTAPLGGCLRRGLFIRIRNILRRVE